MPLEIILKKPYSSQKMNTTTNKLGYKKVAIKASLRHKTDRPCILRIGDNKEILGKKKRPTTCRLYYLLILTILLSSCAICACVYAATSVIQANVLAEVMAYQEKLQKETTAVQSDPLYDSYDGSKGGALVVTKRSADSRRGNNRGAGGGRGRRRRTRGGRGRREDRQCNCHHHQHHNDSPKSAVHMLSATNRTYHDPSLQNGPSNNFFVWSEGDYRNFINLRYNRSTNHQSPNDVIGITVLQAGLYELYSQVVVQGLAQRIYPYFYAQEIVLIRNRQVEKTLIKSFKTQQQNYHLNGDTMLPLDTAYQFGVFYLHANDEVRVASRTNIRFSSSPDDKQAFYFGVVQK